MAKIKYYILFFVTTLFVWEASAQCNLGQSASTVCAGEAVSFWVTNPNPNFEYRFRIEGQDINGDSIVWSFNGQEQDRNALVRILRRQKGTTGNFLNCCCTPQATVRVRASPDPSLGFLSGSISLGGIITNCKATFASPDFLLEIANESRTPNSNTSYTVDWGDGSPVFTSSDMTTLSHTYTQVGFFTLSFTVRGNGTPNCNEVTRKYTIFNGSDPDLSINAPPIKRELCRFEGIRYEITNTASNTVGTTYEVLLNGVLLDEYVHPPPNFYDLLFDKTSCNESYQGIVGIYIYEIRAKNPCLTTPVFQTDGPITVGDTLIPLIQIKDTICVNTITEIANITDNYNVMNNCERVKLADWKIWPDTGWSLVSTVPASPAGSLIQKERLRINFTSVGVYNVRMVVENECRLREFRDSIDTVIVVIDEPMPDVVVELGDGCAPDTLKITNNSTGVINSYRWRITPMAGVQFLNGTSASDRDPEIFINRGGNYTIALDVENKCKKKTWQTTVAIIAKPEIVLDPIPDQCNNFTYTPNLRGDFFNAIINWTFGGASNITTYVGPQPPPIIWNTTGNFFVQVTASTSCGTELIRHDFNVVSLDPPKISKDTIVCLKSSPFNLRSSESGGAWSGVGITNSILGTFSPNSVPGVGQYKVYYDFIGGLCSIRDSVTITVESVNNLYAGDDLTVCLDDPPIVLSGNTPTGGVWFGEGLENVNTGLFNPKLVTNSPTTIGYIFTDLNSCTDTAYRQISIIGAIPLVFPSFGDTICVGIDSIFFDFSSVAGIRTFNWDFGDGTLKTGSIVGHAYQNTGSYDISVQAISDGDCVTEIDTTIFVKTRPTINPTFTPKEGCGDLLVEFNPQITNRPVSGNSYTHQWIFGDGNTSQQSNPINLYSVANIGDTSYAFRVTVGNACGNATYRDTVDVFKVPFTRFGTSKKEYCSREEVVIFNSSSLNTEYYIWDFGNGNTSNVRNPPPQTYPALDRDSVFTIRLTSGNRCGEATFTQIITIKANVVVAGFLSDPISGCSPLTVNFANFATTPGSSLIWVLGDGNTAFNQDSIRHVYRQPGQYTASLTADNGCRTDTRTQLITVNPSPIISYDFPRRVCVGDEVPFTNTTTGAVGYQWSFGDGLGSLLVSPLHTYFEEGVYTVNLLASSSNGCKDSLKRLIEVFDRPIAAFEVVNNEICANSFIEIRNNTINGNGFEWDFGDGTQLVGFSPLKRYTEPGIYTITLIAVNANTCRDTFILENAVRIFETPTADFTYFQTGGNEILGEVQFENLSIGATEFFWNLGDGTTTSEVNPFHKYSISGNVTIKLIAFNNFGCSDSIQKDILVEFLGELFLPNAFVPDIGTSETSVFKPKGFGLRSYKIEIFSTYGELLWSSTTLENGAPSEGWNGTFKGTPLPQDVYVWKITAVFQNGKSWAGVDDGKGKTTNIGTLLLIR